MIPSTVGFSFSTSEARFLLSCFVSPYCNYFPLSSSLTLPPLSNNAFVSLIPSPILLFDCRHSVCVLFPLIHRVLWLIHLTYSTACLDFDIDASNVWFIALCITELCGCVTCWHWVTTAQLIEHFLKLDIWLAYWISKWLELAVFYFLLWERSVLVSWIIYLLPESKAKETLHKC